MHAEKSSAEAWWEVGPVSVTISRHLVHHLVTGKATASCPTLAARPKPAWMSMDLGSTQWVHSFTVKLFPDHKCADFETVLKGALYDVMLITDMQQRPCFLDA